MEVIRTPDHRVRVFVSSTLGELADERRAVRAAIEGLHLTPVMFEVGARPHPPRALYRAYLEQSDVFVGIYWERYGWVAPDEAMSGLEDEYELARTTLPQLVYLKEPAPNREERLVTLLERIQEHDQLSYRRFSTPEELAALVSDDLAVLLSERFGDGDRDERVVRAPPPAPLDVTLGREDDVAAIVQLLTHGNRLVTLTGAGGIGKSRLGVEVAVAMRDAFPDGAVYVPLASLTDPSLVLPTIAERVGAHADRREDVPDALTAVLAQRPTLVLLDNFEHVTDAAPDLAALLGRTPSTVAIVTSRHLLRVSGEQEYRVPPLADAAAIELFRERASAGGSSLDFDDEELAAIAEICRRLDGLPLAIELAAAWARIIPPTALLERIVDHAELPGARDADLPERQRTLRATMEWSYSLLGDAERELFARLAVFSGGWSLAAAEAVCGSDEAPGVLETMASLLEKSLIVSVGDAHLEPRFRMLETVRSYADERFDEMEDRDEVERRHIDWMIGVLFEELGSGDDPRSIARIDRERANLRAAVRRALDRGDAGAVSVLVQGSMAYLSLRDSELEGAHWLDAAISKADDAEPIVRARLLVSRALLAAALASYGEAERLLHAARSADAGIFEDAFSGAIALMAEAIVETTRDPAGALPLAIRAAEAMTEVHSGAGATYMWMTSGMVTLDDDPDQARTFLRRALDLAGEMGNDDLRSQTIAMLGFCAWGQDEDLAVQHFVEAAALSQHSGQRSSMILAIEGLSVAALIVGLPEVAARAYGCAATTRARLQRPPWAASQPILDAIERRAMTELGSDAFDTAVGEGATLDIAEGLDRALAELTQARGIDRGP